MKHNLLSAWPTCVSCVGAGSFLVCSFSAEAAQPLQLTHDSAIQLALAQNPDLMVESLGVDRADSATRWTGRLSNPELEVSGAVDDFGNDEGEQAFEIAVIQDFPVTSRRGKQRAVSKLDADIARAQQQVRERALAHEVDIVWIELWAAEQSTTLQKTLLDLNQDIVTFMEHQAAIGVLSFLDTVQANLNSQLLSQELGRSRQEAIAARNRLKQLLGLPPDRKINIVQDLSLPKTAPAQSLDPSTAIKNQPLLRSLELQQQRGDTTIDLAKAQRWSDLSVKAFVERERAKDEPAGLENETMVGLGLSLPLPLRDRNQQAIEAAQLDRREAQQRIEAQRFLFTHALQAALDRRALAYALAADARLKTLPMAEQSFADLKTAYESGQASLIQVQQAQAQLLELETSTLELETDFHRANADVRHLIGNYPSSQTTPKAP